MLPATLSEREIRRAIGLSETGNRTINGLAPLSAREDHCLYFINKKLTTSICESISLCQGCIVIVPRGSPFSSELANCVVLEVADPRLAIAKVLKFIKDEGRHQPWVNEPKVSRTAKISPLASVSNAVEIGADVIIEPFCVVDADVRIGSGSILRSGVRIYSRVSIGDASIIGSNTVIGHQGYGFVRDESGNKMRIPHLGGVVIGSQVEIGAMTTVPSGTISPTTIEDFAKIDDHVHVGHNVRVARGASVTAAVVIGGSAVIDTEAWVGINSSIRDGRRVGSRSLVGMDTSLQQELPDDSVARAPRPDIRTRDDDDASAIGFTEG